MINPLPSWLDEYFGAAPPIAEFNFVASNVATTRTTYSRAGGRKVDLTNYPEQTGGRTRSVTFFCDVQKTAGASSVEVQLYDVTHAVQVAPAHFTHSADAALTELASVLVVGSEAGNLRDDVAAVYEVQVKMNGGGGSDAVFITNARIVITYS